MFPGFSVGSLSFYIRSMTNDKVIDLYWKGAGLEPRLAHIMLTAGFLVIRG